MPEEPLPASAPPVITRPDRPPTDGSPAILLMDKPAGMSSFGVIRRLRTFLGVKKIGHAGTLDPAATGLLVCLVGRPATRLQDHFMRLGKTYTGTLRLGQTTASFDAESEVVEERDASGVTGEALEAARKQFVGEIEQRPPMYSAVKMGGERLYKKARRGETVERPARPVTIYRFELTDRRGDEVDFVVECSKGTYIRTLAHDLGQALGPAGQGQAVGAHLAALRRTAIGPYRVEDAWTLEGLAEALGSRQP